VAIGDDAAHAGYPLVPNSGAGAQVSLGAQEINRTRDFVAQVKALVLGVWPVSKGGTGASTTFQAKSNLGFHWGNAPASDAVGGTDNGNIYFKIVG
jgi:hypothetical protein